MRGVTQNGYLVQIIIRISTHTPHARRDRAAWTVKEGAKIFQLTRLMRGVTALV